MKKIILELLICISIIYSTLCNEKQTKASACMAITKARITQDSVINKI